MIRPVHTNDVQAMLDIYTPIVQGSHWSFELEVPGLEAFAERVERISAFYPFLVLEEQDGVLGYAYASRFRERAAYLPSVETTIYMAEHAHGKGHGTRLYTTLIESLRLAGFRQLYAGISLPNPVSVAFHEKMGYEKVGLLPEAGFKFEKWWDVGLWYRKVEAPNSDPMDVTPFPELQEQEAFKALVANVELPE